MGRAKQSFRRRGKDSQIPNPGRLESNYIGLCQGALSCVKGTNAVSIPIAGSPRGCFQFPSPPAARPCSSAVATAPRSVCYLHKHPLRKGRLNAERLKDAHWWVSSSTSKIGGAVPAGPFPQAHLDPRQHPPGQPGPGLPQDLETRSRPLGEAAARALLRAVRDPSKRERQLPPRRWVAR